VVFFEIGEKATPTVNLSFTDPGTSGVMVEYPTAGVEGTVLSKNPTATIESKDPATYTYLLSFESPILASGVSGTLSLSQAWFTGQDLGVSPVTDIPEFVNVSNAYSSLSVAAATTSTAASVVESLKVNLPPTATRLSTIENLNDMVGSINTKVTSTAIEGDGFAQQESAGQANIVANYTANDAVLLQEAAENIAAQEQVLYTEHVELTNVKASIDYTSGQTLKQDIENMILFMDTYYINPVADAPSGTGPTDDTNLQKVLGSPYIVPETELAKLKL
jgi:hypothetical protein